MVRSPLRWLALWLLLPACPVTDSPGDGMVPVVVDNGNCGDLIRFTGEYVDWDSSGSKLCGIFGARFVCASTHSRVGSTVCSTAT